MCFSFFGCPNIGGCVISPFGVRSLSECDISDSVSSAERSTEVMSLSSSSLSVGFLLVYVGRLIKTVPLLLLGEN